MKELILIQIENAISSLQIEEAYRLAESIDLCLDDRLSNHFNLRWFRKYLTLKGCIKDKIINLTNIENLYLAHNNLKELPKEIYNLTNLKSLSLHTNNLTELPKEIGNLTYLEILSLYNNNLTELPTEIKELIKRNKL